MHIACATQVTAHPYGLKAKELGYRSSGGHKLHPDRHKTCGGVCTVLLLKHRAQVGRQFESLCGTESPVEPRRGRLPGSRWNRLMAGVLQSNHRKPLFASPAENSDSRHHYGQIELTRPRPRSAAVALLRRQCNSAVLYLPSRSAHAQQPCAVWCGEDVWRVCRRAQLDNHVPTRRA